LDSLDNDDFAGFQAIENDDTGPYALSHLDRPCRYSVFAIDYQDERSGLVLLDRSLRNDDARL
jgi:hypothetical protein